MSRQDRTGLIQQKIAHLSNQHHLLQIGTGPHKLLRNKVFRCQIGGWAAGALSQKPKAVDPVFTAERFDPSTMPSQLWTYFFFQHLLDLFQHCDSSSAEQPYRDISAISSTASQSKPIIFPYSLIWAIALASSFLCSRLPWRAIMIRWAWGEPAPCRDSVR